jgi:hypothetical protein
MKKLLLLLSFVLAFPVSAQIVNIPDTNLKAELLDYVPSIDTNNDNEIQMSEALIPTQLFLTSANISSLTGIEAFTNLTFLNVAGNNLTTVTLNGLVNLNGFNADYNQLTSFSMGNADGLATLSLNDNNLATLDLSGKTVNYVSCTHNNMIQLTLNDAEIQQLHCENNALTSLDLLFMSSLQKLFCYSNQITELNFANNVMLQRVECQNNPITGLDFSNNPILFEVNIYNPQLEYISFKNGANSTIYMTFLGDLDNPLSVCADDDDIDYWKDLFALMGIANVYVSSYCSFVPGGNYNTISGGIKHDVGNDGCGTNEPMMPYYRVNISDGASGGAVFTTAEGTYDVYAQTGTYTVAPEMTYDYFNVIPPSAQVTFTTENNVTPQDFCLERDGIHNDLDVVIIPEIPARPGFESTYLVSYHNKGTETLSGTVDFVYVESVMDFVSADVTPQTIDPGMLTWAFTDLAPFETRTVLVTLISNTPTDTPPVTIGMQLDFAAHVYPVENDETPLDNIFGMKQTVVGSFDPNDITCLEGETIAPAMVGEYLHYLIRFQNTGTFYAENVVVVNDIDAAKFDIDSFEMLGTSHPGVTRITGNKTEFIFEGIELPAEQDDEPGSHGFIAYKIKTNNNLVVGNSVAQHADIYFDFNPPITTNVATTTVTLLGNDDIALSSLKVYPNPVRDVLTIEANEAIKSVSLLDLRGRLLSHTDQTANHVLLNIGGQERGVYVLKIVGDSGSKILKVIKE